MRVVLQRVKNSSVTIDGKLYSEIGKGLMLLLGVEKGDTIDNARWLADKILKLRVFEDENEKMNYSIVDVKGEIVALEFMN